MKVNIPTKLIYVLVFAVLSYGFIWLSSLTFFTPLVAPLIYVSSLALLYVLFLKGSSHNPKAPELSAENFHEALEVIAKGLSTIIAKQAELEQRLASTERVVGELPDRLRDLFKEVFRK